MFCILASNSPRRQAILQQMGIDFCVFAPTTDENCEGISVEAVPIFLARKKLHEALTRLFQTENIHNAEQNSFKKADFVLAADTVIIFNGKSYGKPHDKTEAANFLRDLSGKTHRVVTAIAVYICATKTTILKSAEAAVTFCTLTETEIQAYLAQNEWPDAAGAYKIQGRGARYISRIEGSYSAVVGLPIFELYETIK